MLTSVSGSAVGIVLWLDRRLAAIKKEITDNHLCTKVIESKLLQQAHDGELFHTEVRFWKTDRDKELVGLHERVSKLEIGKSRKK